MISDLPIELQNKIMFYVLEHPCATMLKEYINSTHIEVHYILNCKSIIYKNPYKRPIWKAGRCKQCKRNGIKLYWFGRCKKCQP